MRALIEVEARDYLGPGGLNRITADKGYETGEVSSYRQSAWFMPSSVYLSILPSQFDESSRYSRRRHDGHCRNVCACKTIRQYNGDFMPPKTDAMDSTRAKRDDGTLRRRA
jgi:hypothetical protein